MKVGYRRCRDPSGGQAVPETGRQGKRRKNRKNRKNRYDDAEFEACAGSTHRS
jgi:hypothetical protein